MSLELLARAQVCAKTLADYAEHPMTLGKRDCARLIVCHIKNMGHKFTLSRFGAYSTLAGAQRAIRKAGYDSLEAVWDEMFERIPPAMAVAGDILAVPSEDGVLPSMAVRLDGQNHLGVMGGGFAIGEVQGFTAAWRVPCLRAADTSEAL